MMNEKKHKSEIYSNKQLEKKKKLNVIKRNFNTKASRSKYLTRIANQERTRKDLERRSCGGETLKDTPRVSPSKKLPVVRKFGNAYKLRDALSLVGYKITTGAIYRWGRPLDSSSGGGGGIVPTNVIPHIMKAARLMGIHLELSDFMIEDFLSLKNVETKRGENPNETT